MRRAQGRVSRVFSSCRARSPLRKRTCAASKGFLCDNTRAERTRERAVGLPLGFWRLVASILRVHASEKTISGERWEMQTMTSGRAWAHYPVGRASNIMPLIIRVSVLALVNDRLELFLFFFLFFRSATCARLNSENALVAQSARVLFVLVADTIVQVTKPLCALSPSCPVSSE